MLNNVLGIGRLSKVVWKKLLVTLPNAWNIIVAKKIMSPNNLTIQKGHCLFVKQGKLLANTPLDPYRYYNAMFWYCNTHVLLNVYTSKSLSPARHRFYYKHIFHPPLKDNIKFCIFFLKLTLQLYDKWIYAIYELSTSYSRNNTLTRVQFPKPHTGNNSWRNV